MHVSRKLCAAIESDIRKGMIASHIIKKRATSPSTVKKVAAMAGLSLACDGRGAEPTNVARNTMIVALRETGLTLEQIGEKYELTRERVRQILANAGRVDLCRIELSDPKVVAEIFTVRCACCGKKQEVRIHQRSLKYCSNKCRVLSTKAYKRAPKIMKLREKGMTWMQIGATMKIPFMSAYRDVEYYGLVEGIDVSRYFGGYRGQAKEIYLAGDPNAYRIVKGRPVRIGA